jgi:hypothetical protein
MRNPAAQPPEPLRRSVPAKALRGSVTAICAHPGRKLERSAREEAPWPFFRST